MELDSLKELEILFADVDVEVGVPFGRDVNLVCLGDPVLVRGVLRFLSFHE